MQNIQDSKLKSLHDAAIEYITGRFENIIVLFDIPEDKLPTSWPYSSKREMVAQLSNWAYASAEFALHLGLITVDELSEIDRQYKQRRPDIFDWSHSSSNV